MPTWQAGPVSAEIILRRVELTLAEPHRAAHGTVAARPTLIVEFRSDNDPASPTAVSGWGECPALPDPGYFYEYTAGAWAMLCDVLIPAGDNVNSPWLGGAWIGGSILVLVLGALAPRRWFDDTPRPPRPPRASESTDGAA